MEPQVAIDLGHDAMKACLLVGGPILLVSLVIGLVIGVLQAMTQVQDQTVSFVPKLMCMMLVIGLGLPWLSEQMIEFGREKFSTPLMPFTTAIPGQVTMSESAKIPRESVPQAAKNANTILPHGEAESPGSSAPTQTPFQLPHYRFSKLPAANIGG